VPRAFVTLLATVLMCPWILAQSSPPYFQGNPDEFLAKSRAKSRPAIVLFNFHLKSG